MEGTFSSYSKNSLESPTLQRHYKPEEFRRIKKDKMLMLTEIDIDRERLTNITRHVKIYVFPSYASIYGFIYCFFILFIFLNLRVYFVATQLSTFKKSTIFFFNSLLLEYHVSWSSRLLGDGGAGGG